MPVGAGILLLLLAPPAGMSGSRQNAAADAVVKYGLALGVDVDSENPDAVHPSAGAAESYARANVFEWLTTQVQDGSDEIPKPPVALREYLMDREDALRALVAALQKDAPDWGETRNGEHLEPHFLLTVRLSRVLLAAALVEEFDGDFIGSGQALDASWSLLVPMAERERIVEQLIATAIEKWQAGVLRKVKQPSLSWQGRLRSDGPWKHMLATLRSETTRVRAAVGVLDPEPFDRAYLDWMTAMNDLLARSSPCELAAMSDEEIGASIERAIGKETLGEAREEDSAGVKILSPNLLNAAKRAGRTEIDRELTLKVLQLRFEKGAAPDGRWPDHLLDPSSAVCPAAEYDYRSDGSGIELRFGGTIDPPSSGQVIPLVFRGRQPAATPTSTPTATPTRPALTPTPSGHRLTER